MLSPGDVVTALLRGAIVAKSRPAVVVSTDLYQATRPDVIVCELTTQLAQVTGPTDYVIQDWRAAGLHYPTALKVYLYTIFPVRAKLIGRLSSRDWQEVRSRLRLALAVT